VVCCASGELNDVQYSIQILDSPVGLAPDGVSFSPLPFLNSRNTFPGINKIKVKLKIYKFFPFMPLSQSL
jgi:hypothetical protein